MAAVERLETLLRSLEALKAPGASGVKIQEITQLCIENIQVESQLIQKIFAQVRRCPNSHKLGVLYVVDSVIRQWITRAGQLGQPLAGNAAPMGTFAAGVHKLTEIVPHIVEEVLLTIPDNQKDKLRKLIDIWESAGTFQRAVLADFRKKLDSPVIRSKTPAGRPPQALLIALGLAPQPPQPVAVPPPAAPSTGLPAGDSNAILTALASLSMPAQANPAPSSTQQPLYQLPPQQQQQQPQHQPMYQQPLQAPQMPQVNQIPPYNVVGNQYGQQVTAAPPASAVPSLPFFPPLSGGFNGAVNVPVPTAPQYGFPAQPPNPVVQPTQPAPNTLLNNEVVMQLLQMMAQGQLTPQQSVQVMSLLGLTPPTAAPSAPPVQAPQTAPPVMPSGPAAGYQQEQTHDPRRHNGHGDQSSKREQDRTRSRSPDFRRSPPNRRDSPTYGSYDPSVGAQGNTVAPPTEPSRGRGKGRRDFRQRTPTGPRNGPDAVNNGHRNVHKNFEIDFSLPQGHIKVLSRTLFVGGVTATEDELREIFSRFGNVQTCTVNKDKRHAFVKMYTRKDSVAAHAGMQALQNDPEVQGKFRQARWGVGFGPREYHNYENGVSVIPIKLLTEADRKWVVTAEYGGTGGEPLQEQLVVEEPDIEIGAGVSSKALSRRVVPGDSGFSGPTASDNHHNNHNNNQSNNNVNNQSNNHSNNQGSNQGSNQTQNQAQNQTQNQTRNQQQPKPQPNLHDFHDVPSGPKGHKAGNNNPPGFGKGRKGGRSAAARHRRAEKEHFRRFSPLVNKQPDPGAPDAPTIVAPPSVPGFGFQLPGMR